MTFEVLMKGRGWLHMWRHAIMSGALAGEVDDDECIADFLLHCCFWAPVTSCSWMNSKIDILVFLSSVSGFGESSSYSSSLICNPDSHSPVGFECQRGNPAWRLFWYCWTLSWKYFLLSDQGCSRFRAIGSLVKTPHLITAVNMFEEPKMCHVCLKQNRSNLEENSCHFKQQRQSCNFATDIRWLKLPLFGPF